MNYLEKGSTSDQRIDVGYHMPGTEIRASAHRYGSAGTHLTHLLDHESPPDPRRPPASSPPGAARPAGPAVAPHAGATARTRAAIILSLLATALLATLAAGPAAAQTSITQTGGGATWTLTGHTSVAAGGKYTFTITLESGTKPFGEYAGFYLTDTADNQDKLGTAPNNCTSPKQFCISFSGGSGDGIFNNLV